MNELKKEDERDLILYSRLKETPYSALYSIDHIDNKDRMVAILNID